MKLSNTIIAISIAFGMISCAEEASTKNENNDNNDLSEVEEDSTGKMYDVDTEESIINWTGSKPTEDHRGTVKLMPTTVELNNKSIVHGDIAVDMRTMTVTDIEDAESNAKLLGHLSSPDFFAIDNFPEAQLRVLETRTQESQNLMTVDLVIKGIVQQAEILYEINYEGDKAIVTGKHTFDRTLYEIKYKSKSVFGDLGDKFINDEITLDFRIVLNEAG